MAADTPKGYSYPTGQDAIADGDNAIATLANQIDTHLGRVAAGAVDITAPTANTTVSAVVTFPVGRFTTSPAVTLAVGSSDPTIAVVGYTIGGSTTSFTLYMNAKSTGARRIGWIAAQYL